MAAFCQPDGRSHGGSSRGQALHQALHDGGVGRLGHSCPLLQPLRLSALRGQSRTCNTSLFPWGKKGRGEEGVKDTILRRIIRGERCLEARTATDGKVKSCRSERQGEGEQGAEPRAVHSSRWHLTLANQGCGLRVTATARDSGGAQLHTRCFSLLFDLGQTHQLGPGDWFMPGSYPKAS